MGGAGGGGGTWGLMRPDSRGKGGGACPPLSRMLFDIEIMACSQAHSTQIQSSRLSAKSSSKLFLWHFNIYILVMRKQWPSNPIRSTQSPDQMAIHTRFRGPPPLYAIYVSYLYHGASKDLLRWPHSIPSLPPHYFLGGPFKQRFQLFQRIQWSCDLVPPKLHLYHSSVRCRIMKGVFLWWLLLSFYAVYFQMYFS